jgi:hypothetical protein
MERGLGILQEDTMQRKPVVLVYRGVKYTRK